MSSSHTRYHIPATPTIRSAVDEPNVPSNIPPLAPPPTTIGIITKSDKTRLPEFIGINNDDEKEKSPIWDSSFFITDSPRHRGTIFITGSNNPDPNRWAHYIINLNIPSTIVDTSIWPNVFSPFTFRFHDNCREFTIPETLHPYWNEKVFRNLICEHHLDVPGYSEVVLGLDFFHIHPSVLIKVKEGQLRISKLSAPCAYFSRKNGSITVYVDCLMDLEAGIGGFGLYEDCDGGWRVWKTVNLNSKHSICLRHVNLLCNALNCALMLISTECPSTTITLVVANPELSKYVDILRALTNEINEQAWEKLTSDCQFEVHQAADGDNLADIKEFVANRRNYAKAMEAEELDLVKLTVPGTDEHSKISVLCTNVLARLGASGRVFEGVNDNELLQANYYTLGIRGNNFYSYDKQMVRRSLGELKEYDRQESRLRLEGHKIDLDKNSTENKTISGNDDNSFQVTTNRSDVSNWIKLTNSPSSSPYNGTSFVRSHLHSLQHDILREVNRLLQNHIHDFRTNQQQLTAQHITSMHQIKAAASNSISEILSHQYQSLAKINAVAEARRFSIPSELKSENIRPTPTASRQASAQTYLYSAYPMSGVSSVAVSRNVSAYSSQQQCNRSHGTQSRMSALQDLKPQPLQPQKRRNMGNIPEAALDQRDWNEQMGNPDMVMIPRFEYDEMKHLSTITSMVADLVGDLAVAFEKQNAQNGGSGVAGCEEDGPYFDEMVWGEHQRPWGRSI